MEKIRPPIQAKNVAIKRLVAKSALANHSDRSPKRAARKSGAQQPSKEETKIYNQIDEEFSQFQKNFPAYSKEGGETISQIATALRERLFVLFQIALGVGIKDAATDNLIPSARAKAVDALCSASRMVNIYLMELAKKGDASAVDYIWDNGAEMVSALKSLAIANPEVVKPKARKEIYMPSLRAKVEYFTDDFAEISDSIELAKDFPTKIGHKAIYHLDSLATQFLINLLKEVEEKRKLLIAVDNFFKSSFDKRFLANRPRNQLFKNVPGIQIDELGYLDLPPYRRETAEIWWNQCVKPILDSPMIHVRIKGSRLEKFLIQGAKKQSDASVRDYLKKLCEPKILESLAP